MAGGKLATIAAENETIIAAGRYTGPSGTVALDALVATSCAGTRSYSPDDTARLLSALSAETVRPAQPTVIEVTGESTMRAARRLVDERGARVAVLNFASARNPGGGYLGGALAQEEDLCRVSALYTTLRQARDYYAAHRAVRDPSYSHRVIYSPDIPVYRDDRYNLLDEPYTVSFLTCPAPNAGVIAHDTPHLVADVPAVLAERAARILAVAAHHDQRNLILGAWGCGVFRNNPAHVAAAFLAHLAAEGPFQNRFDRVVFAVLDRTPGRPNLTAFQTAFATYRSHTPGNMPPDQHR